MSKTTRAERAENALSVFEKRYLWLDEKIAAKNISPGSFLHEEQAAIRYAVRLLKADLELIKAENAARAVD